MTDTYLIFNQFYGKLSMCGFSCEMGFSNWKEPNKLMWEILKRKFDSIAILVLVNDFVNPSSVVQ